MSDKVSYYSLTEDQKVDILAQCQDVFNSGDSGSSLYLECFALLDGDSPNPPMVSVETVEALTNTGNFGDLLLANAPLILSVANLIAPILLIFFLIKLNRNMNLKTSPQ